MMWFVFGIVTCLALDTLFSIYEGRSHHYPKIVSIIFWIVSFLLIVSQVITLIAYLVIYYLLHDLFISVKEPLLRSSTDSRDPL